MFQKQAEKKGRKTCGYTLCPGTHYKSWEECTPSEKLSTTITISEEDTSGAYLSTHFKGTYGPSGIVTIMMPNQDYITLRMQHGIVSVFYSSR